MLAPQTRQARVPAQANSAANWCASSVAVPTVARRSYSRRSGVTAIATPSPLTASTAASGPSRVAWRSYIDRLSR